MTTHRAILIAGPTASGKSALAIALARRHDGVVVNADSMQIYRDLEILTARPSADELRQCRHALYGYVGGHEPYSVGRWLADVKAVMEEQWRIGSLPVVVGGTGLYFKALLEGLSPIPSVPDAVREHWRGEARRLAPAALHVVLEARDPVTAARLMPTDRQRVTRALEVLDATGRGLADWQRQRDRPVLAAEDALLLVAAPERAAIYARADERFDRMIAGGAIAEVERLAARGYSDDLPIMRALGVVPLLAAQSGSLPLLQAVRQAKLDTRHYIKRQETWLRRNMIAWKRLSTQQMEGFDEESFTLIRS